MGMDTFGKSPTDDAGRYFRASVWMWAPLHEQMCRICNDLLSDELLESLAYNGGAGPDDQETCTEMANRFEAALADSPDGFVDESDTMRVTKDGCLVHLDPASPAGREGTRAAFRIGRNEVLKWISFLRHCGGFAVW